MYKITIKTATAEIEVSNLDMNGNNYVAASKIDTSAWPAVFEFTATGTYTDETGEQREYYEHYDHAKIIQQVTYPWDEGKWYLAFCPVTPQEYAAMQQQGQIEYIAMMTDVEL